MKQVQKELRMKTTRINVDGKPIIVGALRGVLNTKLMEAPSLVKSFNEENGTNLRLIRPTTADRLLKTNQWRKVKDAMPSPVDMAIAFEKPNQKISNTIVFAADGEPRVILATTGNAKGERDVAILVPDIIAIDIKREGNDYVIEVPESRLVVVPDFPAENGWYKTYRNTTVPYGKELEPPGYAQVDTERKLTREKMKSYVGLLVPDVCIGGSCYGQSINAFYKPSHGLGVAVEIPEGTRENLQYSKNLE